MTEEREAIHRRAIERERENRWNAKGRACVTHPKYGSVVVPHSSNLAALMNAAGILGLRLVGDHRRVGHGGKTRRRPGSETERVLQPGCK